MDKIRTIEESVSVFATTNMPWELDIAALRRFERKILVPMPNQDTRSKIISLHAGKHHDLKPDDIEWLAKQTEGYSGSDMSTLVNDGLMRPIKEIQEATPFKKAIRQELRDSGVLKPEDEEEENDEDAGEPEEFVWMPVCTDPENDEYDLALINDPSV